MPFQPTYAYIGAGARVIFRDPCNLNKRIVMAMKPARCSLSMISVLTPLSLTTEILQSAVDDENLDRVRFRVENHANPNLKQSLNEHLILAIAAIPAPIEISELLIAWGAEVRASSASTITSHSGRADLVKLLLKNGSDINEMGVAVMTWKT